MGFMKALQVIIFLLFFCSSFGQTKSCYNIVLSAGDTTFWNKYQNEIAKKLSLPSLAINQAIEHFRIWTSNQILEIWQDKNGVASGMLTTWADEYISYNEEQTNRTFSKSSLLSSDTARLLREYFLASGIRQLPTQDSIQGWEQGLDGTEYLIEYATNSYYSFKSYWSPKSQDSLKEALLVQCFIDSSFNLANSKTILKQFSKEVPFESYHNGGPSVTARILSAEKRKKYIKERRSYLKSKHKKNKANKS
jgi:hypothetical protein